MTSVPVAAYFENFLGPWKPVEASDGEYYTLGKWKVAVKANQTPAVLPAFLSSVDACHLSAYHVLSSV